MREVKFFICKHCGNLITMLNSTPVPVDCCGEHMTELVANTVDAAQEKHVPVVKVEGNTVSVVVGSVAHPMIEAHYIQWIYLVTEQGEQVKHLTPNSEPTAVFALAEGDKFVAAYEYCNLHGLWKA
ncbi:MAG TPA: desulfoferrodoxin [Candidatus Avacidaminococcus intestinavium]|uniref:Desulfoferrodoxin n=1 Tax=Candidatus Avacidaminococcus intestinavium TaxID=2840684 RepID=A0A9D1SMC7_9FIRM|nr:desulfoferrodoxin [Candidatus Avacidaminococcus intestinavium]